jgi:hypothetical protein
LARLGSSTAPTLPGVDSHHLGGIHFRRDGLEAFFGAVIGQDRLLFLFSAPCRRDIPDFGDGKPVIDRSGTLLRGTDPALSPDGRTLYFTRDGQIYVTRRATWDDPFDVPTSFEVVNHDSFLEGDPFVSADGTTLYFDTNRDGDYNIYSVRLDRPGAKPMPVTINLPFKNDSAPILTDDNLTIYFSSNRLSSLNNDIWMAQRTTERDGFGEPISVVSLEPMDYPEAISPDGCTLWYDSTPAGQGQIYYSQRPRR